MYKRVSYEKSIQILETVMINHFHGWLRLPITNLVDRGDIIRFCCSRSWQAAHILRALFALNQIDHPSDYFYLEQGIDVLPRRPDRTYSMLYTLTCSSDFRSAAMAGLDLMREIVVMAGASYPEIRSESFLQTTTSRTPVSSTVQQRRQLAQMVAEAYTCVRGIRAMILEGSLAKGITDMTSDIDLRAYCSDLPDLDSRRTCARVLDKNSRTIPENDRLTIGGIYAHIDFELIDNIEGIFAAFPDPPWWAPAKWEPIQIGEIAWDRDNILPKWKRIVSEMPPEPKKNLISELLRRLNDEKERFHRAIEENSPVFSSILLGNMLSYYFQILCIVNHRFIVFPKWMNHLIHGIDRKPENMYERFCVMLSRDLYQENLAELAEEFEILLSDLQMLIDEFYLDTLT